MITAVQQLDGEGGGPCALLVFPRVDAVRGERGSVALLQPNGLAFYVLKLNGRHRAFVFRTVSEPSITHTLLPGVAPGVELLLEVRTDRRVRRVRQLFAALARQGHAPSSLSDDFFVRAGVALNGKADFPIDSLVRTLRARDAALSRGLGAA